MPKNVILKFSLKIVPFSITTWKYRLGNWLLKFLFVERMSLFTIWKSDLITESNTCPTGMLDKVALQLSEHGTVMVKRGLSTGLPQAGVERLLCLSQASWASRATGSTAEPRCECQEALALSRSPNTWEEMGVFGQKAVSTWEGKNFCVSVLHSDRNQKLFLVFT